MAQGTWQAYLEGQFPGFLLPQTDRCQLTRESAARFLECLGLGAASLPLLCGMSLLAAHGDRLREFACYWLPELVRSLPSHSEVEQRTWRGGFHGRLDIRATLPLHINGDRSAFVTRARRRQFDLPENVFVRSLASRTERLLQSLQSKALLHGEGWTAPVVESLASLRWLTSSTVLREVPEAPVEGYQLQAARNARHSAYRSALVWYEAVADALDHNDPERLATVLSQGALRPVSDAKRFEVAVLLTLLAGVERRLPAQDGWSISRGLIASGRNAIATFQRADGSRVDIYYDQAVLPLTDALGPRDRGVAHYLASGGRLRPDITMRVETADGRVNYIVFEIKLSENVAYAASGYAEAIVYRHEYAVYLIGWPKAVLVTSLASCGKPRLDDDVVAVAWSQLEDSSILEAILLPFQ